ncbi:recQ-like DNA helicase BLM [Gadus chalcogrammus]|uniref:recQ-like DNA helicase BLM n=1 Tax=Gadus chalcogrammus TaxID=1042646 RepID=UPI0024C4980D|nr:recQ-like DNA helicase BLM [Gadus chalcogrammus]
MSGNPADQVHVFYRSPAKLKAILRKTFHLKEFRENQLEAINATFEGKDVFVVGDNGAGKSLCYQLPACLFHGVTVVISPTISLILDQIQKLTKLGIVARKLLAAREDRDAKGIYEMLKEEAPMIKLLYVTPEKMRMSDRLKMALQRLFQRGLLARFVIDEAQCLSLSDIKHFRKAFGKLIELLEVFPGVPKIALSGPVRKSTQKEILNQLHKTNSQLFMYFNQRNLKYAVLTTTTKSLETDCITWIMEHYPHDSGIVYCGRRVDCVSMAMGLNMAGLPACSYHAGKNIAYSDREIAQNKWNRNECQVICATAQSFGFGIDKPDVRYVIHTFLPKSMENYYRETGRAGRDGNMSHCILFYSDSDYHQLHYVIRIDEFDDDEPENRELVDLGPMAEYCQNTADCRRRQLLTYLRWGDIEANVCLPNSEAICDNCEGDNAAAAATPRTNQQPFLKPAQ